MEKTLKNTLKKTREELCDELNTQYHCCVSFSSIFQKKDMLSFLCWDDLCWDDLCWDEKKNIDHINIDHVNITNEHQ